MNSYTRALIGIVIIAVVGGLVFWQQEKKEEKAAIDSQMQEQVTVKQGTYTLADVAKHASKDDCWSAINDGVYNLTSWIPRHPGGERAIEGLCGKDGSAAFNGQHGGGATQAQILTTMKVGTLVQ